jgi:hypothetical protein
MVRLFAFLAVLLAGASAARASSTQPFEAGGNWTGQAHFTDEGQFSFCAVTADYVNGVQLGFVMTPDFQFGISLYSASWSMRTESKFDVSMSVDRRWSRRFEAEAIDPTALIIWIGDEPAGFEALRRGYVLSIATASASYDLNLTGSSNAFARTSECVLAHSGGSSNRLASAADQVAGFLLAAGVESATMMTAEESREIWGVDHVAWRVGQGWGAIFTDPLNGQTPEAFVSGVMSTLGSDCKGAFASGSKPAPAGSMRRFFSACRGETYTLHTLGVSVFFEDGEVLTIVHIADDAGYPAIADADERVSAGLIRWGAP